jgi:hypothetical protein
MGDQQLGAERDRLVHDLPHRVDRDEYTAHLRLRIAADGPHGVPLLGVLRGP